ncbi:hypothetical protein SVI_0586 [Shewanella violacea DSS12]|uniref:Phospholipase A1 n=1 Tax=Shewanella violacea (strain JCM 10179 / CIP 106290 / LMG 19151 / DSS12) TaxID=637905 RepID=D4ZFV8_SHEVD|nr:hypothetical protein SVI_0586 [Shewanella violacea DSS12]
MEAKFQISLKFSLMYKVFDDNPDILDYMANFELTDVYGVDEHRFTLMLRNNLSSDKYGAAEATWS